MSGATPWASNAQYDFCFRLYGELRILSVTYGHNIGGGHRRLCRRIQSVFFTYCDNVWDDAVRFEGPVVIAASPKPRLYLNKYNKKDEGGGGGVTPRV